MATSRTPTAGQPVQVNSGSQVADISALLGALFGQSQTGTTTMNAGDTTALQQLLAQLQSTDYTAALQSIFQQAAGQIPGFQAAYGNAMGARSGGNTAMQAALNQLLQQTTLAGAKQTADMQLQNQQIQANAAGNVAQATRGTTQTTKQETPGMAKELMGVVALMQAAQKLTGSKNLEELGQKIGFGSAPAQTTAPATPAPQTMTQAPAQQVTGAQAPQMSMATGVNTLASLLGGNAGTAGQNNAFADMGLSPDMYDFGGGMSYAPGMEPLQINELIGGGGMSTSPLVQAPNILDYFGPEPTDYGSSFNDATEFDYSAYY